MIWKRACAIKRDRVGSPLQNAIIREEFKKAALAVKQEIGRVDSELRYGKLGATDAVEALRSAVGVARANEYVMPEKVQAAVSRALWHDDSRGPESVWAVRSAKAFLETCAHHDLGVRFCT